MFEHAIFFAEIAGASVFGFIENHPADLAAEHVVITFVLLECFAEADLRQAGAVERRGVEITHASLPRRMHGGLRFRFRNGAEHVAQRGGAEAQLAGQFVFQAHGFFLDRFWVCVTVEQILDCGTETVQDIICST